MVSSLQNAIELLSNVTEAFTAALFLFDEGQKELVLTAHHTLSKHLDTEVVLEPGDGIVGWVAKSGQAVNIPNFDRKTQSLGIYLEDEPIKSFLAVPLGRLGVLCVDSKQTYIFTDKDQKILEGFVKIFQELIEADQAIKREKDYAKMLALLHAVDRAETMAGGLEEYVGLVLGELKKFTKAELAFLTSPDNDGQRYRVEAVEGVIGPNFKGTSYPLELGLVGWVYREQQPLTLRRVKDSDQRSYVFSPTDPIKKFKSFLGLPLSAWGRGIGVIGLVGFESRDWSADQVAVANMAGRWIAAALTTWPDKEEV